MDTSEVIKTNQEPARPKQNILWNWTIGYIFIHLGMIYGFYLIGTLQVKLLTLLWAWMYGSFGLLCMTAGTHRLFSHRSFKASQPVRLLMIFGFVICGLYSTWLWAKDHRQHHKHCDTDGDPYNSRRGFFYSHTGWFLVKRLPEVTKRGREIDMSDLNADPWIMFQKKYFKSLFFLIGVLLPGVVPVYLWNESWSYSIGVAFFVRYTLSLHFAFSINSFAHYFGTRPYTKEITPVENIWVSLITPGEGWHNYHHTFPWDYRASEYGKINYATSFIDFVAKFGWVTDLRTTTDEMIAYRIAKRGDGTHPLSKSATGASSRPDLEFQADDIFGKNFAQHYSNKVA